MEVRRQLDYRISLFSGIESNVDVDQGLGGVCDFLLSLSPLQLALAVTTGSLWKFLRLLKTVLSVDVTEYHISQVEQIIGLLVARLREARLHQPGAEL